MPKQRKLFFVHALPAGLVIAANSTVRQVITIGNDADFFCKHIVIPVANVGLTLQIEDSSGELWFSRAVRADLVGMGANSNDRPLMAGRMVPRNTTVTFTIANGTGGNLTIEIALWGWKIFRR